MALTLAAKAPASVYRYTWTVPVADGDRAATATATVSSGTASILTQELSNNALTFFVTGGAAGETTVIAVTSATNDGETIADTLYLPIRSSANTLGNTGRDIVDFAIRKVTGGDMDAEQLADGLERLSDMLASWSRQGADIGVAWPVGADDAILADDATISAVKNNLILRLVDRYEFNPSPFVVEEARRGLQLVKASLLPDDRGSVGNY